MTRFAVAIPEGSLSFLGLYSALTSVTEQAPLTVEQVDCVVPVPPTTVEVSPRIWAPSAMKLIVVPSATMLPIRSAARAVIIVSTPS